MPVIPLQPSLLMPNLFSPNLDPNRPATPANSPPSSGRAGDLNWEGLWRQLEAGWQELPRRSEETLQQTLARLQLEWGGLCREARDRLQATLDKARATSSPEPLQQDLQALLPLLSPRQWEVVIGSLERAADRAWVASLLYHSLQDQAYSGAETNGIPSWAGALTAEQRSTLEAMSLRAYGNSRLPLVVDKSGEIQVKASAALLAALIAVEIGSVGSAGALSLLGTPELRKLLNAEGKLRRSVLKQGRTALTEEEWQTLRQWLDPKGSPPDWYLSLTQLGIQTTQVGDYLARRLREFFQSEWIKLVIPPLYHLVIDAVRLLTGEVFLSVGTTLEAALESAEAERRLELLLQALPQARHIPSPERIQAALPAVVEAAETTLRPLLGRQLMTVADIFDPPLRNESLNELGRQLNLWNPLQFLLTWGTSGWLEALLDQIKELQQTYPEMPLWESYRQGVEAAVQAPRVMEQAEALRLTAKSLDPEIEPADD
jgi:hypothetical protein